MIINRLDGTNPASWQLAFDNLDAAVLIRHKGESTSLTKRPENKPSVSRADVERMSASELRQKLKNPEFAAAVDALYARN